MFYFYTKIQFWGCFHLLKMLQAKRWILTIHLSSSWKTAATRIKWSLQGLMMCGTTQNMWVCPQFRAKVKRWSWTLIVMKSIVEHKYEKRNWSHRQDVRFPLKCLLWLLQILVCNALNSQRLFDCLWMECLTNFGEVILIRKWKKFMGWISLESGCALNYVINLLMFVLVFFYFICTIVIVPYLVAKKKILRLVVTTS